MALVPVSLIDVGITAPHHQPIMMLREEDANRCLCIWIGHAEAQSILNGKESFPPERPNTHDLIGAFMNVLGARIKEVRVQDVDDGVFYADIIVQTRDGNELVVDARPSDAIAIAVRQHVPVFVEEAVFEQAGFELETDDVEDQIQAFKSFIETVNPEDFLSDEGT